MKAPSSFEHFKSILLLPFMAIVVIPALIQIIFNGLLPTPVIGVTGRFILAVLFFISGLLLFIRSINLFNKIGKGTLAPWNPTKKLVVKGIYRYTRNPMIVGVFLILIGESLFLNSAVVFIWALIFIIINHLHFIFKEEPDLTKKFGRDYEKYKKNVPRWFPRLKPWQY